MNNDSPCICFAVPPLFSKGIGKSWIQHPQMGGKDLSNHHQMPPALAAVTKGLSPSLKSLAEVSRFILHEYKGRDRSAEGKATALMLLLSAQSLSLLLWSSNTLTSASKRRLRGQPVAQRPDLTTTPEPTAVLLPVLAEAESHPGFWSQGASSITKEHLPWAHTDWDQQVLDQVEEVTPQGQLLPKQGVQDSLPRKD